MMFFTRIVLIILDSLGVGALPDAADYGDIGANTLRNMAAACGGIRIPILEQFGIGNLASVAGVARSGQAAAYHTVAVEMSTGKDTMTGHWEIMGIRTDKPLKTFTESGFPADLVTLLEERTGRKFVGNIAASGTQIIEDYGEHHMKTGDPILYTSADSVLQIAGHEQVLGLEELYRICSIAREITLREAWKVGRVIARPFTGSPGHFVRTANRHDYALKPPAPTVLNSLKDAGYDMISIGKINDIYAGEGVTRALRSQSNDDGMAILEQVIREPFRGLAYLNLVDFDMKYGHRRDSAGYVRALETFDRQLDKCLSLLHESDLLIITADHGNDPTFKGTDHTREYVPVLIYGKALREMRQLDPMATFADIGATIAGNFQVNNPGIGRSVLGELR